MKTLSRARRGSVLIVAMLLAGIIGISLVSYLRLSINSLKQAQRSYLSNTAMNLAEVGLEQGIYAFNQVDELGATASFTAAGFTLNADGSAQRLMPLASATPNYYDSGENSRGTVRVYVQNYAGSTPRIITRSTIASSNVRGPSIEKWLMVTLRKRSIFSYGMVAKDQISFSGGNVYADSWNSDPDNNPGTAPVPYSPSVKDDNIIVGCTSTGNGMIDISNGEVLGYVATGGGTMSKGPGGSVHPVGTLTHDPNRVTADFSAQFPTITTPPALSPIFITGNITGTTTFPRASPADAPAADGKYYYVFSAGAAILPNGNNDITIAGDCVFIMNNHGSATAISTSGNQDWTINNGAKMTVYTNGNVSIAGTSGINNGNAQPISCLIYSTETSPTSTQTVNIKGNGVLKAVVYAPNAAVTINGGGSTGAVFGSVIGKSISLTGGANFHYDESLGNLTAGNPYAISAWTELTSKSERNTYLSVLSF